MTDRDSRGHPFERPGGNRARHSAPPDWSVLGQLPGAIGEVRAFDPGWCLVVAPDKESRRVAESLLCLADGMIGTRGVLEDDDEMSVEAVTVAGLFEPAEGIGERLVTLPSWCALPLTSTPMGWRVLDLRDGLLLRYVEQGGAVVRTARFACAARPGTAVLVAELPVGGTVGSAPADPEVSVRASALGGTVAHARTTVTTDPRRPTVGTDARQEEEHPIRTEVVATYLVSNGRPERRRVATSLAEAAAEGPGRLLDEQRLAWARRWLEADVEVVGDIETTRALRFALFHLLSSVRRRGETALGARGLTGPAYAGHVFWDTDVFALPVLAAVDRRAARSVLEYRLRRLDQARARAARDGRAGARFPWESAHSGDDVTPGSGVDQHGDVVPIFTGSLEEHITADVAWALWRYAAWEGSWAILGGAGRPLMTETARYWQSRLRRDDHGRAHIDRVIGPDEYHEDVDDNTFTNLMARWNLRRGAEVVSRFGPIHDEASEAAAWRASAEALVDNYDERTGCYEQFAGYGRLEPLLATDLGTPPLAADLVLGPARTRRSQVIKQADVLMAHFLVPEETAPGSLRANLDHYLPRTAHGSSLSPSVHSALAARAGMTSTALELLRVAISIDLEDLTETTAGGLHLANFGGLWQAVVHGFAGVRVARPDDRHLSIDPVLPEGWQELRLRLRWHGRALRLACRSGGVEVGCDRPVVVSVHGTTARIEPPGRWVE